MDDLAFKLSCCHPAVLMSKLLEGLHMHVFWMDSDMLQPLGLYAEG